MSRPDRWLRGPLRWPAFVLAALPLAWLVISAVTNRLGPDPAKALVDQTGLWAIRMLWLCLAMTPLRLITGWGGWLLYRRMLGLYAAFYASLHLMAYAVLLLGLDLGMLGRELIKRPYIVVGFTAWCLLIPLVITSTRQWQKRLGRKWLWLHCMVYFIALLVLLHFIWLKKTGLLAVWPYALILFLLFLVRIPTLRRRIAEIPRA